MPRSLHPNANLEVHKKEARELLQSHKDSSTSCCETLRLLHRFEGKSDSEILGTELKLTEAQYALALDYGFGSWRALKEHVLSMPPSPKTGSNHLPDYGSLTLNGNGHQQDHFSIAVRGACKLLGREVQYDGTACLSGNAFALATHVTEAPCWWNSMYSRDTSIDLMAASIGLSVRPLEIEIEQPPAPEDSRELEEWLAKYERGPKIPLIRDAQARGEVVLVWREWVVNGPHGFVPWAWWGIITETRDDGTVLGASLNGHNDNPLSWLARLYAVGNTEPTLSPIDADREMLRRAVHRIRSDASPYTPDDSASGGQRIIYGLDAMDVWIEQMATVPFCPSCPEDRPDDVWTCAHSAAGPLYGGAKAVDSYLSHRCSDLPKDAQPAIRKTAAHYNNMASLLSPAMTDRGEEHYRSFIGDAAKQAEHIDQVLEPIKDEMSRAADEMERAVSAMQ